MAKENLIITIGSDELVISPNEYFVLSNGRCVLLHETLERIAKEYGVKIEKTELEYANYTNNDFCFVYRCYGFVDGNLESEVGEANIFNCKNSIAKEVPATMADKRAKDRMLIRMLGLKGQVYSDTEIDTSTLDKNSSSTPILANRPIVRNNVPTNNNVSNDVEDVNIETSIEEPTTTPINIDINNSEAILKAAIDECKPNKKTPIIESDESVENTSNGNSEATNGDMTVETARALVLTFGKYRKNNMTLGELRENKPMEFEKLANASLDNLSANVRPVVIAAKFLKEND